MSPPAGPILQRDATSGGLAGLLAAGLLLTGYTMGDFHIGISLPF